MEQQLWEAIDSRDYGRLVQIHARDRRYASEAVRQIDLLSAETTAEFARYLDEADSTPIGEGENIIVSYLSDLESIGPVIRDLLSGEEHKYHSVYLQDIRTLFGRLSLMCRYLDEVISVADARHSEAVQIYETVALRFPFHNFYNDLLRLYHDVESDDVQDEIRDLYAQSLFLPPSVLAHDSEVTMRFLLSWIEHEDAHVRSELLSLLMYGMPELEPTFGQELVRRFLNDDDTGLRSRARRLSGGVDGSS
ncbi:MAG: hypothetical protein MI724_17400 [Spirochaetales bacterium]|nr:hypothetical protein [Spirochaetales bacterium]